MSFLLNHRELIQMNTPVSFRHHQSQRGVVLPIALIMLVIISFAGLLAARNSTTHEQFSDNMRTNQMARQFAEEALRHCERIAMDSFEEGSEFDSNVKNKISTTEVASEAADEIKKGIWNIKDSWKNNAINLIVVTPRYGSGIEKKIPAINNPRCIIQKMSNDRFLVTSRGLSADALTDTDQINLVAGSEVWLQSVLSPRIPIKSENDGLGDDNS